MKYLDKESVKEGNIIDFNDEDLLLIKPVGEQISFIDEDYSVKEVPVNDDTKIYIKQRWLIEVQPRTAFDFKFKTHKTIIWEGGVYQDLVDEFPRLSYNTIEDRRVQLIHTKYEATKDPDLKDDSSLIF